MTKYAWVRNNCKFAQGSNLVEGIFAEDAYEYLLHRDSPLGKFFRKYVWDADRGSNRDDAPFFTIGLHVDVK